MNLLPTWNQQKVKIVEIVGVLPLVCGNGWVGFTCVCLSYLFEETMIFYMFLSFISETG